jgi:acyl-CoA synthetase (AMP-forming)/AMP-acid ligase II
MNLFRVLERTAQTHPRQAAVLCEGDSRTYAELHSRSSSLAGALQQAGIGKGTSVGILARNCIEWVETLFALARIGAACVPLNWRLTRAELFELVVFAEVRALFYGADLAERVPWDDPGIETFVCIGNPGDQAALSYEALLASSACSQPLAGVHPGDASSIIFTAGTTGPPKAVVLTHAAQLWNTLNYTAAYGFARREQELAPTPLFHTSTLGRVFTYVFNAVTFIICRRFDAEQCLEIIQRHKVTSITQTPTQYALMLAGCRDKPWHTASIRRVVTGAAAMPPATKQALRDLFPLAYFFDLYGMTEAGPGIAIIGGEDFFRRPDSVGRPLLSVEVAIEDDQGRPAAAGQPGEILCRGPNIMQGYYKNMPDTDTALRNGWLHTGDMGMLDSEGFLYIVGRQKDVIISGGVNIYPGEVENVLMGHPAVQAASVIGIPDDVWGEQVVAAVVRHPAAHCTEQELIDYCRQQLAGFKCPRILSFVASLPRNAAGKVMRQEVRMKYLELRR